MNIIPRKRIIFLIEAVGDRIASIAFQKMASRLKENSRQWETLNFQLIIPNYSGDAKVILNPYFKKINIKPETLNEYGFGIIVSSWLRDIISENININEIGEYQDILINSGLYDSIVEGNLNYEVAA